MKDVKNLVAKNPQVNFNDKQIDARVVLKVYDRLLDVIRTTQNGILMTHLNPRNGRLWLM